MTHLHKLHFTFSHITHTESSSVGTPGKISRPFSPCSFNLAPSAKIMFSNRAISSTMFSGWTLHHRLRLVQMDWHGRIKHELGGEELTCPLFGYRAMLNTRSIVSAKQHSKEIIHTSQDFLEIQIVLLLIYLPGRQYTRGTRSSVS